MSELKFTGTATLTGFPRDKSFNFELDGPDRLVVKAGREIFVVIEKEPLVTLVAETTKALEKLVVATAPEVEAVSAEVAPLTPVNAETEEEKTRKPRGPSVKINEESIIQIDPNRANQYTKLRGKYFETLKTANGRTVAWWKETSMVKSLEGQPITLLKFFLSEGVLTLIPQSAGQPPANPTPIVPGPLWSPQTPGGQPGGNGGGATFM